MSVASLAGYLNNGGQSTYYKDYTLNDETDLTNINTQTVLFGANDIIPPVGTYLVTTFMFLKSYAEGTQAGSIDTFEVIVIYDTQDTQTLINNQLYQGTLTSQCTIQTSGIFVSDGTGSLIVGANVLTATDATQYNISLANNLSPQVQIVKIA